MKRQMQETVEECEVRAEESLHGLRLAVGVIIACHTHLEKMKERIETNYPDLADKLEEAWGDVFDGLDEIGERCTKYATEVMEIT